MQSPRDVLLRLRALEQPGLALLESAGVVTPYGRYSLLSAAPTRTSRALPERPVSSALFPAWIGGVTYEGAHHWAYHPSGLVWDRVAGTLKVVGEPHLDWSAVLGAAPAQPEEPQLDPLESDFPQERFEAGVREVQNLILAGECYQVNLSHRMRGGYRGDPLWAYLRLAEVNPSPFMAYLEAQDFTVCSSSPECLVRWENEALSMRPIAGTRRRGQDEAEDAALERELSGDDKERAEHVMLLDLARNDLGRVGEAGSVWVSEMFSVERYSHVMHLVSEVRAQAKKDLTLEGLLEATFPGGTITGAPKARVREAIAALEPCPRGWYTGSLGVVSGAWVDLNILIRTLAFWREEGEGKRDVGAMPASPPFGQEQARLSGSMPTGSQPTHHPPPSPCYQLHLSSGAGIVIDSDPRREYRETQNKAAALLAALNPSSDVRPARASAAPVHGPSWHPPLAPIPDSQSPIPAVLLLDNFDSFTYNLVQDLESLGARVTVRPHTDPLERLVALLEGGRALLLGPGPGTPLESGVLLDLARCALEQSVPTLGVCLGHQALGELLGARLLRAPYPVHGKLERLEHAGEGLFAGIAPGAAFTRYHSLIVRDLPRETARAIARGQNGELMALEALHHPAWGVQFHPESVLSASGRTLLLNWLTLAQAHLHPVPTPS